LRRKKVHPAFEKKAIRVKGTIIKEKGDYREKGSPKRKKWA